MKRILSILIVLIVVASFILPATPVSASVVMTFTTSASDNYMDSYNAVYNTAWTSATADDLYDPVGTFSAVGQQLSGSDYYVFRPGLYFDTSSLNDAVTITGATLNLYGKSDSSTTDFNITVQSGMPTYPHDPMVVGDFDKSLYTDGGGTLTTAGWSTAGYNTLNLSATGLTWINKTGTTKFLLRSSRDIAGTAPTGDERVSFWSYEKGAGYRPTLTVTYTVANPAITAVTASNIASTTATLNAQVASDGGDVGACTVKFGYGTTSQAAVNFNSYDTITSVTVPVSVYSTGEFPYLNVTGLTPATPYYYRAQVTNFHSTVTSTDEITFTTVNVPTIPLSVSVIPNTTSNVLSWAKGAGSTNTLIRYRLDTYPTTTVDGTQIYLDAGATYTHSSLTSGTTYYYALWGKDSGNYSATYATIAVTTKGYTNIPAGGEPLPTPVFPSEMFQATDVSATSPFSHFEPIYSLVINAAASMGMTTPEAQGSLFAVGALVLIAIFALIILIATKSLVGALMTSSILMALCVPLKVLPWEYVALSIFFALGAWAVGRNEGSSA